MNRHKLIIKKENKIIAVLSIYPSKVRENRARHGLGKV